ncbi:MAG: hypothetical protein BHV68_02735 [Bacteroidales bacterium 43_8]|nr:MAG: hypothetical protein BHV68_02735 [Bacteroidales bacterium 43_8]
MKKLFILLIVSLCINVCHAQKNNSDPLYSNGKTKTSLKKENKEKRKKENPVYIDQRFLVAGSVTIGIGLGVIGIGNAAILDKINDEKDADKIEKLRKNQRLINYIGGGIGVLGCILCLTSVKRDFSGGYAITKRLSFKDKKRGLALVYRF